MDLAFSVIPIIPKTYDMAISSILRYYNAKTVYSISLLYDLNVVKIYSKQRNSNYRTSIHCHKVKFGSWSQVLYGENTAPTFHYAPLSA